MAIKLQYTEAEQLLQQQLGLEIAEAYQVFKKERQQLYKKHPPAFIDSEDIEDGVDFSTFKQSPELRQEYDSWLEEHGNEYSVIMTRLYSTIDGINRRLNKIEDAAFNRKFDLLKENPGNALEDAKEQANLLIEAEIATYEAMEKAPTTEGFTVPHLTPLPGGKWGLAAAPTKAFLQYELRAYYPILETQKDLTGETLATMLDAYLDFMLANHPRVTADASRAGQPIEIRYEGVKITYPELQLYVPFLHGAGLDDLAKLSRNRMDLQKHHITGVRSIAAGGLTLQEEALQETSKPKGKGKQKKALKPLTDKERDVHNDKLFRAIAGKLSSVAALKLMDILAIQLTKNNSFKTDRPETLVELPLTAYMELCGMPLTKPSIDKARREVRELLEAFYAVSLTWEEDRDGRGKERYHTRILQSRSEIKNSIIYAQLAENIAAYICGAYGMPFPLALLKVDERNQNSYPLGRKLAIHYSNFNNHKRGTANIISVKALLEHAPGIPTYEEVMASPAKNVTYRIVRAFKAAMDNLGFVEWEYCNAKKAPLTKEQQQNFNYDTFIGCYVKFRLLDAPNLQAKIEARDEKAEKAQAKKAEKPKRSKGKQDAE